MGTKILIIDHNDSFTFNLVQQFEKAGAELVDVVSVSKMELNRVEFYDGIVLSPGPGLPEDYPGDFALLERYAHYKNILGICLGLQTISVYYGAELFNLEKVQHGRQVELSCKEESSLFNNMEFPIKVGLYHSWAIMQTNLPSNIKITSIMKNGTIMSIEHRLHSVFGVQFHPESYMTLKGQQIIQNWLQLMN